MENKLALDLISGTKGEAGQGGISLAINRITPVSNQWIRYSAHYNDTRSSKSAQCRKCARLLFSDIHEGLVLVQISQSWGDKESDWLHLSLRLMSLAWP